MKQLIQVIYVSRSTFESTEPANKIEPNVARILAKSRVNNRKNGLVGVLYFGDGVFFQCLEGDESKVNALLSKLDTDTRHKDIKVLSKKYIDELSFSDWAMKFAPLDEEISSFLKENGFQKFDPYLFSDELTNKFLSRLFDAYDPTIELNRPPTLERSENIITVSAPSLNSEKMRSNLALALSVLALLISLVALYLSIS